MKYTKKNRRHKSYRKSQGLFKSRKSKVVKSGEKYVYKGYDAVLKVITENKDRLVPGWSISRTDAVISKFLDEPRNQDEVNRAILWTQAIINNKAYSKSTSEFEKFLIQLQHTQLQN